MVYPYISPLFTYKQAANAMMGWVGRLGLLCWKREGQSAGWLDTATATPAASYDRAAGGHSNKGPGDRHRVKSEVAQNFNFHPDSFSDYKIVIKYEEIIHKTLFYWVWLIMFKVELLLEVLNWNISASLLSCGLKLKSFLALIFYILK